MFRRGCTFGVEIADEFSDESFDFERSTPLLREVEKCLEPTPEDRIRAQHLLRAIDRQINNLSVPLPLELKEGDVLEYVQELRWAT